LKLEAIGKSRQDANPRYLHQGKHSKRDRPRKSRFLYTISEGVSLMTRVYPKVYPLGQGEALYKKADCKYSDKVTLADCSNFELVSQISAHLTLYTAVVWSICLKRPIRILLIKILRISSSICAVLGGFLVASKLSISGYGFIILALSSSQLLISSILDRDKFLVFYSAAVFMFVDLYGVYRWLLR
jgi:hypothetical protein